MAQITKTGQDIREQDLKQSLTNIEIRGIKSFIGDVAIEVGLPPLGGMFLAYHSGRYAEHAQLTIQAKFDIEEDIQASYFTMNNEGRLLLVAFDTNDEVVFYYID